MKPWKRIRNHPFAGISVRFVRTTILCMVVLSVQSTLPYCYGQSKKDRDQANYKNVFARAKALYDNDEIGKDEAAKLFSQVIEHSPFAQDREDARFYLADYWHRRYYISSVTDLGQNSADLLSAYSKYEDYIHHQDIHHHKRGRWYSDARFEKALILLKRGNVKQALDQLSLITKYSNQDPTIFIRQIIWSPNSIDQINSSFDSRQLAAYALSVIRKYQFAKQSDVFDKVVAELTVWCKSQR